MRARLHSVGRDQPAPPRVGNEHDVKPVRVDERDAVCLPVRVFRLDRLSADALACLAECVQATEVEDEQAVRVGGGPAVFRRPS